MHGRWAGCWSRSSEQRARELGRCCLLQKHMLCAMYVLHGCAAFAYCSGVLDEDDAYGIMEDYVTHDNVESYDVEGTAMMRP